MKKEAENTLQPELNGGDEALNLPFLDPQYKETPQEGHDWLNKEFQKLPYRLYKYWLILSICIAIIVECFFMKDMYTLHKVSSSTQAKEIIISQSLISINHIILLFGSGQMLFGIAKMKARIAQRALTKFQICLISSTCYLIVHIILKGFGFGISLLKVFALPILVFGNLVGGLFVLKAFKKNHPLTREPSLQAVSNDFLQQNAVIAAEILKYDEQLESWPYLVYRFWLGICFMLNIFLCWVASSLIVKKWHAGPRELESSISLFLVCFMNVVCISEMFVALRRKLLVRSKRAISLLKILIYMTIIRSAIWEFPKEGLFDSLTDLALCLVSPLVSLFGAVKVRNILEQREEFVQISNYNGGESYL